MNQIIMIFLGLWFIFLAVIIGYWGTVAWFYPARLKPKLEQGSQPGSARLQVLRIVTLIGAISLTILGIMFVLSLIS